ncbi:Helix-turn-helix domain-containing protein [Amycolatopsis xylanica]|uniref:Helix-turn-helix domain-containing protein n=1 Tax=Amycolatopsis xylanica TaxID=589385 RepID=A0A1H2T151_9PSEU|nr:helix-turn-helix transcriptional regulator [Amycolatopsis xylanica]SDW37581.1 Helix-turn-helix domain-containing protein [Amycolatopsis xylanica]
MSSSAFPVDVGHRIRKARRTRGLSLRTTAELAGFSPGFLSMVENGTRTLDRLSHISALADALRVAPGDLVGTSLPSTSPHWDTATRDLRGTLLAVSSAVRPHETSAELTSAVDDACHLMNHGEYLILLRRLPSLIGRCTDLRQLLRLYHSVCVPMLLDIGHLDLAAFVVELGRTHAEVLADPAENAVNTLWRSKTCTRAGAWTDGAAMAERALGEFSGSPAVRGKLHLAAAQAKVHFDQTTAFSHLAEAERLAASAAPEPLAALPFTPTLVRFHRMLRLYDVGRFEQIIEAADAPYDVTTRMYAAGIQLMVGCSYARVAGQASRAVTHLQRAERIAPLPVRVDAHTRQAVSALLGTQSPGRTGRDIRGLAHRLGL